MTPPKPPSGTSKPRKPQPSSPQAASPALFVTGTDPLAVAPAAVTGIVAALAGFTPVPVAYEPKAAEALLAAYRPRLSAIAADRLEIPRFDVGATCGALLTAHALTQAPPLLAVYKAAAAEGQFHFANLDHLRDGSLVLLHTYRQAETAGAFQSSAKIPAALDKESAEVEARMQKVNEHFFGADAELGPILRLLSPGTSYSDRAGDLLGYADMYEAKLDVVSTDPVHYRATDVASARRLAGEIFAALGAAMSPKAREAYDLALRSWTFVKPVYFEVQELGLRALRYDPQRAARFPSPYVAGRAGQGRKKAVTMGGPESPPKPPGSDHA